MDSASVLDMLLIPPKSLNQSMRPLVYRLESSIFLCGQRRQNKTLSKNFDDCTHHNPYKIVTGAVFFLCVCVDEGWGVGWGMIEQIRRNSDKFKIFFKSLVVYDLDTCFFLYRFFNLKKS